MTSPREQHPRERRRAAEQGGGAEPAFAPPADVYESDADFLILVDVPGADREGIELTAEEGELTLTARVRETRPGQPLREEFGAGDWRRSFRMHGIEPQEAEAELSDGVLRIRLPKRADLARRSVPIEPQ